jgi:hypothetical protein
MPPVLTKIERREYKYMLDERTAERVVKDISPFCRLDPVKGDEYTIGSLYFDTPDLKLYRAQEEGRVNRFKLRVRTYPGGKGKAPVFFEIKRKVDDVILKSRGAVPPDWPKLLTGNDGEAPPESGSPEGDAAVRSFILLARVYHCQPTMMVRYRRIAFESMVDPYARVSFDRAVACQPVHDYSFATDEGAWRPLDDPINQDTPDSRACLELKFTQHVPTWMVNLVRRFDLERVSYSKYALSIALWYLPNGARASARVW